jgi:hypothetical protein
VKLNDLIYLYASMLPRIKVLKVYKVGDIVLATREEEVAVTADFGYRFSRRERRKLRRFLREKVNVVEDATLLWPIDLRRVLSKHKELNLKAFSLLVRLGFYDYKERELVDGFLKGEIPCI